MRSILHGTHVQIQNNTRDIERLDQLVETMRTSHITKNEIEIEFSKKL